MQAHPQSIPAARIPVTTLSPPTATAHPMPSGSHSPLHPPRQRQAQTWSRYLLNAAPAVSAAVAVVPVAASTQGVGIAQAAGLAHDAGNLLGALGLYCDLLRAPGVLRPEHLHYATELTLIASRSSDLIQRLLASPSTPAQTVATAPPEQLNRRPEPSRTGSSALEFQPTDVRRRDAPPHPGHGRRLSHASVLSDLSPVLERIAAGSARVSVRAPAMLPPIDLPIEALERITVNLVRNAAEAIRTQRLNVPPRGQNADAAASAARPAGQIRVALSLAAGRLQLTVEDDGPGVPPAVAAAFLQPRPLPPNTTRGLGHRIVHELVTSSGGQLSIRVRPSQGTVFCIKWPIPNATSERFDATNIPAPPPPSSLSVQGEPSTC